MRRRASLLPQEPDRPFRFAYSSGCIAELRQARVFEFLTFGVRLFPCDRLAYRVERRRPILHALPSRARGVARRWKRLDPPIGQAEPWTVLRRNRLRQSGRSRSRWKAAHSVAGGLGHQGPNGRCPDRTVAHPGWRRRPGRSLGLGVLARSGITTEQKKLEWDHRERPQARRLAKGMKSQMQP